VVDWITYKAIAFQKEFKAEILQEVKTMKDQDMTLINERLNNIDKNVGDTKSDVRMIKQHLMDRR
jgi:tetrahydromethanopterin S-methyltransferase subunit G